MIKIYLTNLGKYNEGYLIGEWIELPIDDEELAQVKQRIGINQRYEEWFITDYETEIPIKINEYDSVKELNDLAHRLEAYQDMELEEIEAYVEAGMGDTIDAMNAIDNGSVTYYSNKSIKELAQELADEHILSLTKDNSIFEFVSRYFDYEAYERDLAYDYTETSKGVIYTC